MTVRAREINFDGLVGPTHHYAGLAIGNLASQGSGQQISNPRAAALQGLTKMRRLYDMGIAQAVIPPQDRPDCGALRAVGFSGTDAQVLQQAHRTEPSLLSAAKAVSVATIVS